MTFARLALAASCLASAACAGALVRPGASPSHRAPDALLVLPGFGYDRAGEAAFRALAPAMAADGFDLYLPTYVARSGLDDSRERLERFVREQRLDRYARVHVFAFIAGGWTINPLVERRLLPNLATLVYDRSPYQERAPRVARERLRLLTWLRYGSTVFDLAETPYRPVQPSDTRVGLIVETIPTRFIARHASTASRQGPYDFACAGFGQAHDDCVYVALNHDELYARFAEVWPDLRAFIRTGRFTASANRSFGA